MKGACLHPQWHEKNPEGTSGQPIADVQPGPAERD